MLVANKRRGDCLNLATVSASIQVQGCPSQTIDNERPNVTIPLERFALYCHDVTWLERPQVLILAPTPLGNRCSACLSEEPTVMPALT